MKKLLSLSITIIVLLSCFVTNVCADTSVNGPIVYVQKSSYTGYYHMDSHCTSISKSYNQMSLSEAISKGCEPCSKCCKGVYATSAENKTNTDNHSDYSTKDTIIFFAFVALIALCIVLLLIVIKQTTKKDRPSKLSNLINTIIFIAIMPSIPYIITAYACFSLPIDKWISVVIMAVCMISLNILPIISDIIVMLVSTIAMCVEIYYGQYDGTYILFFILYSIIFIYKMRLYSNAAKERNETKTVKKTNKIKFTPKKAKGNDDIFAKEMFKFFVETEKNKDIVFKSQRPDKEDFGFCAENPIFTEDILSTNKYLERLRTSKGEQLTWERKGSTSATILNGTMDIIVDIYKLFLNGVEYTEIYVCPYGHNSENVPKYFMLIDEKNS